MNRRIVNKNNDGKVQVEFSPQDYSDKRIDNYHGIYLGYEPDDFQIIYKLHNVQFDKSGHKFMWLMMHNSSACTSINHVSSWETIEGALQAAVDKGWKVFQITGIHQLLKNTLGV